MASCGVDLGERSLRVCANPGEDPDRVEHFIADNVLPRVASLDGTCLHASAVALDGGAFVLIGPSGAGKRPWQPASGSTARSARRRLRQHQGWARSSGAPPEPALAGLRCPAEHRRVDDRWDRKGSCCLSRTGSYASDRRSGDGGPRRGCRLTRCWRFGGSTPPAERDATARDTCSSRRARPSHRVPQSLRTPENDLAQRHADRPSRALRRAGGPGVCPAQVLGTRVV